MSETLQKWIVPPGEGRVRLDLFLLGRLPDESRSRIQSWIRSSRVLVNRERSKTGQMLRAGDEISLSRPAAPVDLPAPEPIPLTVLYQDSDLAVIDKPAGVVCHLGAGVRSGTLVNALLFHLGPLETGDPLRPGIVHRLDKQTSGVMVVAKNPLAHRKLSEQFKSRQVRKEYAALVHGHPAPAAGTIDVAVGRDPVHRTKISVRGRKRRTAVTHFVTERLYGPFTLLRVHIETGRTHQIRVHLAHRGHPVVGDTLYGAGRESRIRETGVKEALEALSRTFLHSARLEFRHPRTGQSLSFTSPLPVELRQFLSLCDRAFEDRAPSSERTRP